MPSFNSVDNKIVLHLDSRWIRMIKCGKDDAVRHGPVLNALRAAVHTVNYVDRATMGFKFRRLSAAIATLSSIS
jgi:hypothetical protein